MSQHLTVIRADLEHLELVAPLFDAYRQFYQQPLDLAKARQYLMGASLKLRAQTFQGTPMPLRVAHDRQLYRAG
jgi:hypothetical protein